MALNLNQHYLNIIKSLTRPGGESLIKSTITEDPLRPLVSIDILQGQDYYYVGPLTGKVNGLFLRHNSVSLDSILENDSTGEGIWTTAIPSPISKLINGVTYYWLSLAINPEATSYVIDIGYINTDTGEQNILDASVPILSGGIFVSKAILPIGLKFVVLKKITTFKLEPVLFHFGSYENPDSLLRLEAKTLCTYSTKDQAVSLEELSLCLLQLMVLYLTPTNINTNTKKIFRSEGYKNTFIADIISNNLSRLARLIDSNISSPRYGSIPSHLTTYLEPYHIYSAEAEKAREANSAIHPSIEVSTRAVGWALLVFCTHKLVFNTDRYTSTIEQLASYISRFDKLPSSGWTNSLRYENSTLIKENSTSTAVISCLALLKAYQVESDVTYLETASRIQSNLDNFLRTDTTYNHSNIIKTFSLESIAYGLLLNFVLNRADIVEKGLDQLQDLIRYDYALPEQRSLNFIQNGVSVDFEDVFGFTSSNSFIDDYKQLSFFSLSTNEVTDLKNVRIINQIIVALVDVLNENFSIYFSNLLLTQQLAIYKEQSKDIYFSKVLYITSLMLDKPLLSYSELSFDEPAKDLATLGFYYKLNLRKLKSFMPLNFQWFASVALTSLGTLGKILLAISKPTANLFLSTNQAYKATALSTATLSHLDQWGKDLLLPRQSSEVDTKYRQRLIASLIKEKLTSDAIIQNLNNLHINVQLREPWLNILRTTNNNDSFGSALLQSSYYAGNNYAVSNLVEIETNQPFNKEAMAEVLNTVATGVKIQVKETLRFTS